METSAKSGNNIEDSYSLITNKILKNINSGSIDLLEVSYLLLFNIFFSDIRNKIRDQIIKWLRKWEKKIREFRFKQLQLLKF